MVDKQGWMRYNNQRRRETNPRRHKGYAAVAHLVERHLAKVEVASSSLVGRSILWKFSSAGRASALQAEGQRFEPVNFHHCGPVAQLVRAPACHAGGRRFEPDPGRCVEMSAVCLAVLRSKTVVTNAEISPFPHKPLHSQVFAGAPLRNPEQICLCSSVGRAGD